jgi:hypothetical protein
VGARAARHPGLRAIARIALLLLPVLVSFAVPLEAQSKAVILTVTPDSATRSVARVRTLNLLEDTPWLTALRQGLPVQIRYRVELWRSRDFVPDAVVKNYEFRIVVRHEPLLDQFSVYRVFPGQAVQSKVYPTPGTLGAALALIYAVPLKPTESGRYYYAASMDVQTLSESDLDDFNKTIRGEITSGGGTSLAERARRLMLILAGLPKLNLTAQSEGFEVQR